MGIRTQGKGTTAFLVSPSVQIFLVRRRTLAGLVHTCVGRSWRGREESSPPDRRRDSPNNSGNNGQQMSMLVLLLGEPLPSAEASFSFPENCLPQHCCAIRWHGGGNAVQQRSRAVVVVAAVCAQPRRAANNQIRPRVKQQGREVENAPTLLTLVWRKGKRVGVFLKGERRGVTQFSDGLTNGREEGGNNRKER